MQPDDRRHFDLSLEARYPHEMTPMERRREEFRLEALRIGALTGASSAPTDMRVAG